MADAAREFLLAALSLGVGLVTANASPLPVLDVAAMTSGSDLVVVGEVTDVRLERRGATASLATWVKVERVMKGSVSGIGSHLRIQLADDLSPTNIARSKHGIFFLRAGRDNSYQSTDPNYPMLPAVAGARRPDAGSADPLTEVAEELGQVLAMPPAPDDSMQWTQAWAAEALRTMPYVNARAALRAAAASPSVTARLWALGVLLSMDGPKPSEAAMIRSLKSMKQSLLNPTVAASHAASVVVRAIEGCISSSKAAPILTELLQSSAPAVRETAASALAGMN
jgi:hypothetical protein